MLKICCWISNYKVIILSLNNIDDKNLVFSWKGKKKKSLSIRNRTEFEKVNAKTHSTLYRKLSLVNFCRSFCFLYGAKQNPRSRVSSFTAQGIWMHETGWVIHWCFFSTYLWIQAYYVDQYVSKNIGKCSNIVMTSCKIMCISLNTAKHSRVAC